MRGEAAPSSKAQHVVGNALISACIQGEEMRRAFDVCVAMLRQALKPDKVNYSALISAWEKGEELRWAFDVFAAMLRPALVPSLIRDMHLEVDSGIMPPRLRARRMGASEAVAAQ